MFITHNPKVSILVPVYNAEAFIEATISAVLEQTFNDFELILLDDASTDGTSAIIKGFNDKRIIYVRNDTNLGISATRNRLIDIAKGEYIAVLDHDDICLPHRLEQQVAFLDKHKDVAMIGSWFELFCRKDAPLWRRAVTNLGWVWCHPLRPEWNDLQKGNVMMHPTIMYRRKLFSDAGIKYRGEYSPAEDYDLVRQAMEHGMILVNLPQVLLRYNLHGKNLSVVRKQEMFDVDKKLKYEIAHFLGRKNKLFYPYWLVMLEKLRLRFMIRENYDV